MNAQTIRLLRIASCANAALKRGKLCQDAKSLGVMVVPLLGARSCAVAAPAEKKVWLR